MDTTLFKMPLYLPAQGATEIEATIIEWHVAEGDRFRKGQALVQVDSAKSVFDFEAPCDGLVIRRFHLEGETLPLDRADHGDRDRRPGDARLDSAGRGRRASAARTVEPSPDAAATSRRRRADRVSRLRRLSARARGDQRGTGRRAFPRSPPNTSTRSPASASAAGPPRTKSPRTWPIRRRWRRSARSGIAAKDIDAVIVATTTPDVAMPSTAAILQDRLNLQTIPAFDLNAACSGWLYAVSVAQGMILSGTAHNVLTVGVDMQSRLLDKSDRSAYFLFGDGAGAAIVSSGAEGHRIHQVVLGADTRGLHMARRERARLRRPQRPRRHRSLDSHRRATPCSASPPRASPTIIRQAIARSGWTAGRNPLDHSPPGQRPHPQGRRQAQRRGLRALLSQRRARGQHLQRQHPPGHGRGRREPPAGRQAGPLLGRRRHDHRGDLGGVVRRKTVFDTFSAPFSALVKDR